MNVIFNNRITSIFISFMITISSVVYFPINIIAETSLELPEFQNTDTLITVNEDKINHEVEISMKKHIIHNVKDVTTIKPCDIILLFDQSNASSENRINIINGVRSLISNLPTPSYSEHKISIAGYGRINNDGSTDYSPDDTKVVKSGCYNTGYYTYDNQNNTTIFNSWNIGDWIEGTTTTAPTLNNNTISNYDECFMSTNTALKILTDDNLVPWNAGASRADVGFIIADKLANLSSLNNINNDRSLILIFVASATPIQNSHGSYTTRAEAINSTLESLVIKNPIIYGLGDYHALLNPTTDISEIDNKDVFDEMMKKVTSKYENETGEHYRYYSTSDSNSIEISIKELLKSVNQDISQLNRQNITLDTESINLLEVLSTCYIDNISNDDYSATVNYYSLSEYNQNGIPIFENTPYETLDNQKIEFTNGNIYYTNDIMPTISYNSNIKLGVLYGEQIELVIKFKLKSGSILLQKVVENLDTSNDYKFRINVVGINPDTNKEFYRSSFEINPNDDGILLRYNNNQNLPNGKYIITEEDTNNFTFKDVKYKNTSQKDFINSKDKSIIVTITDNQSAIVIYNNSFNGKIISDVSFKNILTM